MAKETRFIEDLDNRDLKEFHKVFCKTQLHAKKFAELFNEKLGRVPGVPPNTPRIQFLDCSVYMLSRGPGAARIGVLVEKMLEVTRYKKWNYNAGFVDGQPNDVRAHLELKNGQRGDLAAVAKEEEEESDMMNDDEGFFQIQIGDIPQAFSHFTFVASHRELLVCDLQGVLDASAVPPVFELTDPVIHRRHKQGSRRNTYGRTDRGDAGIHNFFKTHECSELCKRLQRKWLANDPVAGRRTLLGDGQPVKW